MSAIQALVAHFGGPQKTATAFGVKAPSVHEWIERDQLPVGRCAKAEELTAGEFTRYQLRPDIFGPAPAANAPDDREAA